VHEIDLLSEGRVQDVANLVGLREDIGGRGGHHDRDGTDLLREPLRRVLHAHVLVGLATDAVDSLHNVPLKLLREYRLHLWYCAKREWVSYTEREREREREREMRTIADERRVGLAQGDLTQIDLILEGAVGVGAVKMRLVGMRGRRKVADTRERVEVVRRARARGREVVLVEIGMQLLAELIQQLVALLELLLTLGQLLAKALTLALAVAELMRQV